MKLRDVLVAVTVIAIVGFSAFLWLSDSGLRHAPDTGLTLIDGKQLELKSLRGKTVIVNFWATTCVGCRREMPHLVELRERFKSKGLEVVGVAMSYDPPDQVAEFVKKFNVPYPVGIDKEDAVANAFGEVRLVPTTFVIDPDGRIVFQKLGEFTPAEIDPVINQAISDGGA